MTKLEEGCLAIVINSVCGNNGKIVKVVKCLGKIYEKSDNIYWEFEGSLPGTKDKSSIPIGNTNRCPKYRLMRIDGYNIHFEECNKELIQEGLNE